MTIGENIRKYRTEAGLTQKSLGELSGVAAGTIQQYELGKRQPRVEQLEKLALILKISVTEILHDDFKERRDKFLNKLIEDASNEDIETMNITEAERNQFKNELVSIIQEKGDVSQASYNWAVAKVADDLILLSIEGHKEAVKRIEELTLLPQYHRKFNLD